MKMTKKIWETEYYRETNRMNRKKILDTAVAAGDITPEIELCQKLYEARYGNSSANHEVDYFIRGLMTLEYTKTFKGIFDYSKKRNRERSSVLNDFQFDLVTSYKEIGEQIIFNEYCNLIRLYLELCELDRTYSSLIFGLGKIKRTTLEKKLADDIYNIAFTAPKTLHLEKELSLFTKAASDMFCQQYPSEADSFHNRITESHPTA